MEQGIWIECVVVGQTLGKAESRCRLLARADAASDNGLAGGAKISGNNFDVF